MLVLPATALALLLTPRLLQVVARRMHPRDFVSVSVRAVVASCALLEVVALLTALPVVAHLTGVASLGHACASAIGPFSTFTVSWVALNIATIGPVMGVRAWRCSRRAARRLEVEPWLGRHSVNRGIDVVVLPTSELVAYSVVGEQRQVVISEGVVSSLTGDELDAVIRHEVAHLDGRHQAVLALLAGLDGAIPLLRFVTSPIRAGIERWADETAADGGHESRSCLRRALDRLAGVVQASPAVAGFNGCSTGERLRRLATAAPVPGMVDRVAAPAYITACLVAAATLLTVHVLEHGFVHLLALCHA